MNTWKLMFNDITTSFKDATKYTPVYFVLGFFMSPIALSTQKAVSGNQNMIALIFSFAGVLGVFLLLTVASFNDNVFDLENITNKLTMYRKTDTNEQFRLAIKSLVYEINAIFVFVVQLLIDMFIFNAMNLFALLLVEISGIASQPIGQDLLFSIGLISLIICLHALSKQRIYRSMREDARKVTMISEAGDV